MSTILVEMKQEHGLSLSEMQRAEATNSAKYLSQNCRPMGEREGKEYSSKKRCRENFSLRAFTVFRLLNLLKLRGSKL